MRQALESLAAHARFAIYLVLLGSACSSSGCVAVAAMTDYVRYNDSCDDFVMGWRNTVWAREAWHARKHEYACHAHRHALGEGFRDGYIAVASGSDGCLPALPPRRYWSWRYQSAEGQAQVAAWFEGYPLGVRAAEEDGAGAYGQIQVSHSIERQYSPEFLSPPVQPQTLPPGRPTPAQPMLGEPIMPAGPLPGRPLPVGPAPIGPLSPGSLPDLPPPQPGNTRLEPARSLPPPEVAPGPSPRAIGYAFPLADTQPSSRALQLAADPFWINP